MNPIKIKGVRTRKAFSRERGFSLMVEAIERGDNIPELMIDLFSSKDSFTGDVVCEAGTVVLQTVFAIRECGYTITTTDLDYKRFLSFGGQRAAYEIAKGLRAKKAEQMAEAMKTLFYLAQFISAVRAQRQILFI